MEEAEQRWRDKVSKAQGFGLLLLFFLSRFSRYGLFGVQHKHTISDVFYLLETYVGFPSRPGSRMTACSRRVDVCHGPSDSGIL